MLLLNYY
ncbi:hypothetical protein CGLO_12935 [Colletotrichum gloeosporioides Cg-14]|nr:hypothetical protein CGLO_12935 [Colletotrichum gloeosporioides Cg-14]